MRTKEGGRPGGSSDLTGAAKYYLEYYWPIFEAETRLPCYALHVITKYNSGHRVLLAALSHSAITPYCSEPPASRPSPPPPPSCSSSLLIPLRPLRLPPIPLSAHSFLFVYSLFLFLFPTHSLIPLCPLLLCPLPALLVFTHSFSPLFLPLDFSVLFSSTFLFFLPFQPSLPSSSSCAFCPSHAVFSSFSSSHLLVFPVHIILFSHFHLPTQTRSSLLSFSFSISLAAIARQGTFICLEWLLRITRDYVKKLRWFPLFHHWNLP